MNAKDLLLVFGFSAKNEDYSPRNSGDLDFATAYKNQKDLTLKFSNYLFTEVSSYIKGCYNDNACEGQARIEAGQRHWLRENDKELWQLRDFLNKFPSSKEQRLKALRASGKGDEQASEQVPLYNELNELISQIDPLPAQTELIRAVNSITAPEAVPVAVPGPSGLSTSSSIPFSLAATPGPSAGVALAPAGPLGTISFETEFSLPADDSDADEVHASEEPVVVKIKKQRRTHGEMAAERKRQEEEREKRKQEKEKKRKLDLEEKEKKEKQREEKRRKLEAKEREKRMKEDRKKQEEETRKQEEEEAKRKACKVVIKRLSARDFSPEFDDGSPSPPEASPQRSQAGPSARSGGGHSPSAYSPPHRSSQSSQSERHHDCSRQQRHGDGNEQATGRRSGDWRERSREQSQIDGERMLLPDFSGLEIWHTLWFLKKIAVKAVEDEAGH